MFYHTHAFYSGRLVGQIEYVVHREKFPILEPIGTAAPKFPSTSDISSSKVMSSTSVGLICPAQGFPVPAFRYVFKSLMF
jgi:hypothetical protein